MRVINAPTSLPSNRGLRRHRTPGLIVATAMVLLATVTAAGAARLIAGARGDQRTGAGDGRKRSRTAAESKLTSALRQEIARMQRRDPNRSPSDGSLVKVDRENRALVDIRAAVVPELRQQIEALGGDIVSSSIRYDTTIAWVPILRLEQLASLSHVRSITPAAEPQGNSSHEMRKR